MATTAEINFIRLVEGGFANSAEANAVLQSTGRLPLLAAYLLELPAGSTIAQGAAVVIRRDGGSSVVNGIIDDATGLPLIDDATGLYLIAA